MRAHRWRWGLWRAFGMADAARFCSRPLRSPNQCLLLAKASCLTRPPLLLGGSKVPNGSGSANQVATRWARILLGFPCFGCVLTGDAGGCDVPLEWLMPHGFAEGRYVHPTNACRTGLWRAYGMDDAARCCSGPLRSPNQCLLLAKASCLTLPPLLLAGSKVPNSSGSADQVATRWAWILLGFPCFGCVLTGDAGGCDVPLEWLMPHGFALPAACQSFLLQPSTFAFSGCEGAKRQRLCRPSGNPVGVNLAAVCLFRMRAHGWRWGLWRAFGTADAARCCSGPLRSPNQCLLLAKAPCFTRPPLLVGGSKVPNGSGSANQVATCWARILLGFPCFGCVLTGDAGGCDVPLEWLMPHGFAQGRYVRPTNACRLPKLPASTVHLCF